jgi:TRAP-type C4-dicarboxylate transport system permease large subunit
MNSVCIQNIAVAMYSAGVIISIGKGIYDANVRLEKAKKNGYNIMYKDYAMESFGGAIIGMVCGLMCPFTVCGRLSVMIFSPKP